MSKATSLNWGSMVQLGSAAGELRVQGVQGHVLTALPLLREWELNQAWPW